MIPPFRRRALASGLALAFGLVRPAEAGPSATFSDWSVSCTDGLSCSASVYREVADEEIHSLALMRDASGDPSPTVTIGLDGKEPPTTPIRFTPDEGEAISFGADDFAVDAWGNVTSVKADVADRLARALRPGRSVRIEFETSEGRQRGVLSTKGLVAALRYMDEAQYRAGTVAAFEAKGPAEARAAATMPKDIARADDLPEAVRRIWTDGPARCAELDGYEPDAIGFSAPAGTGTLFGLICGSPGAYNAINRFYRLDEDGSAVPVFLPGMSRKGPIALDSAMNADWDDRTKILTSFAKGRGIGDCGTYDRWHLDDEGLGFVLIESRAKDDCDGDIEDGPETWEKFWPK